MNSRNLIPLSRTLQILLLIFAFVTLTAAQDRTWQTFAPKDGAWTILAPGEMRGDSAALDPSSPRGGYSYTDFNGFFAVVYQDIPRRFVPWGPSYSGYFKKVRNDAVKAANGELIKDEEFSSGTIKGREVHIRISNNAAAAGRETQIKRSYRIERFRMFFHEKRFYLVLAVLPESEIYTPAIDAYLNSFKPKEKS